MTGTDRARARRAFTLIEVLIVVSILGVVMGMTTIALTSASAETAMSTTECALQNTTNQFLQRFVSELRNASRATITIDSDGAGIRFQVPVDWDADGDVVDASGNPEYGSTLGRQHQEGADIVYRFIPNQGEGEELIEAALGIDVDGDPSGDPGYMTERFYRGLLARTAEGIGDLRAASDRWFLVQNTGGGPPTEPIFEQAGDGTITIRLLAATVMRRQETPIRALVTTSVRPFNE